MSKVTFSVLAEVVCERVASGDCAPRPPAGMTTFSDHLKRTGVLHAADGTPVHAAERMRFDEEGAWFS